MEKYLIINGGSSSLKFSLYEIIGDNEKELVSGYFEKIGLEDSFYTLKSNGKTKKYNMLVPDHITAVKTMLEKLIEEKYIESLESIKGVGHRVLHGGEFYNDSVIITPDVLDNIKSLIPFGPLHLPGEIASIESLMNVLPNVLEVAVFDTAFHQTIPDYNYLYAIPEKYYNKYGIRKYGFHGTSHKYINEVMQEKLGKKDINIISCHIGSGASICVIKDGISYNTTMGFTPLDGLIMGTRSGTIDASIVDFICNKENINSSECINILNKESGLLGVSGVSSDLRDVESASNDNTKALRAIKMYIKSIVKFIAEYYVDLEGNIDAIVFTAGVGENSSSIRSSVVNALSKALNINLNVEENDKIAKFKDKQEGIITTSDSKFPVYVIPTNEEYMILKDTKRLTKENIKKLRKENI